MQPHQELHLPRKQWLQDCKTSRVDGLWRLLCHIFPVSLGFLLLSHDLSIERLEIIRAAVFISPLQRLKCVSKTFCFLSPLLSYSMAANTFEHSCSCCQEVSTSKKEAEFICPGGTKVTQTYVYVEKCGCYERECTLKEIPPSKQRRRRRWSNIEQSSFPLINVNLFMTLFTRID